MTNVGVDPRPMEWYLRVSYYLLVCLWPMLGLAFVVSFPPVRLSWVALLGVTGSVLVGCSVVVAHQSFSRLYRGQTVRPLGALGWAFLAANLLSGGAIVAFGLARDAIPVALLGAMLASSLVAVLPLLPLRQAVLTGLVFGVGYLVLGVSGLPGPLGLRIFRSGQGVFIGFLYLMSCWLTVWMLRVLWRLDAARDTNARLAVAEERLRISRDLHDIFGRTLATISVKSTLAAELSRRGRGSQAAGEMDGIREIADRAGREVRQVVHGARAMDLTSELEGARSVLASAGVECQVRADVAWIRPEVAERLGWVTREAVTNILRHSRATWCRIEVGSQDPVRLTVVNDAPIPGTTGTAKGLHGMRQRMAEVGGHLDVERTEDEFRLSVIIPNRPARPLADPPPHREGSTP